MDQYLTLDQAFFGARLKYNRANDLVAWLIPKYNEESTPSEIVTKRNHNSGLMELTLIVYPCPLIVPLVVGEILHNLRNCLDYMISAIVSNISRSVETRVGFPFHATKESFIKSRNSQKLFKVAPEIWEIIETEFRPYADEDGNKILWSINRLNNDDKHRLLTVNNSAGAAAGNHQAGGGFGFSNVFQKIGAGEYVIAAGWHVAHQMNTHDDVVIFGPEALGNVSLFPFLQECLRIVATIGDALEKQLFIGQVDVNET